LLLRGGDYEANQVPVKNGTYFTYYVRSTVCLPVKDRTHFGFSKDRNLCSVRNSGNPTGMCNLATEGVVQLPVDSKHPSKPLGAWACRLLPSCAEEGLGACCSGPWESCGSAQISTSCWLQVVASCFTPFACDCSRLSTNVHGSDVPVTTVE